MNKINIKKFILPAVFFAFLICVGGATVFMRKSGYSSDEKRYLAEFPTFSADALASGKFQDKLERYLGDHIFGRKLFVGLDAYFSLAMGRNTVSDIYNGSDGYLINAPKDADTEIFERNLKRFNTFTDACGIPSTLMLVPTAGYVLKDKLPPFHGKYRDDELLSLASELTPSVAFIDTRRALLSAAEEGQVYYRTDHHLTSEGNYALYSLYCSVKGFSCPDKESYTVEKAGGFNGTAKSGSGYWLCPADEIEMWDIGDSVRVSIDDGDGEVRTADSLFFKDKLSEDDKYPVFLDGNHSIVKIENKNAPGGKILVIKDSYAQCFAAFLAHSYKEIYMLDLRYYRGCVSEFAEKNKIDEILYMYGINSLLTDTNSAWLF